ncbi:MAG: hypothetical protein ABI177_12285 [Edaphobacter sp.]
MQRTVLSQNGNKTVAFDKIPDSCPVCLHAASPIDINVGFQMNDDSLQIVFRCPRLQCGSHFIASYEHQRGSGIFLFRNLKPQTHRPSLKSEAISTLSPAFVRIINQAEIAETQQLDEIAGVGYRRALEFLIKDYLIGSASTEEQKNLIKKTFLGKCIADFVKNDNIKLVSKRAVWLGNDETHYVRKWEDKDIKDLKVLIAMTVAWIEIELFTAQLEIDMPDPLVGANL